MGFDELVKRISPVLKRITLKLKQAGFMDEEDLYQEALIHLWNNFKSGCLVDKTDSYILQGCYFHLKNYLRKIRSKARVVNFEDLKSGDGDLNEAVFSIKRESVSAALDCRMYIEEILNNGLSKREKDVFCFCVEGLTVREIGSRLGISHVMVVKIKKGMRKKLHKYHPLS